MCVCLFQVAVKAISKDKVKDSADMRHIRREMEIMSSIRHPHIIQIYEGKRFYVSQCETPCAYTG